MKKRLLAFLLAVSIAVSMLVMPASAAGQQHRRPDCHHAGRYGFRADRQHWMQPSPAAHLPECWPLTRPTGRASLLRGQWAPSTPTCPAPRQWAPYVRIAVQQGWMNGYTDGSFRPNNAVTLEEACTAVLKLLGYKMTDLSGAFPDGPAQQGQRDSACVTGLDRRQGESHELRGLRRPALQRPHRQQRQWRGLRHDPGLYREQWSGGRLHRPAQQLGRAPSWLRRAPSCPSSRASVYRNDKVSAPQS